MRLASSLNRVRYSPPSISDFAWAGKVNENALRGLGPTRGRHRQLDVMLLGRFAQKTLVRVGVVHMENVDVFLSVKRRAPGISTTAAVAGLNAAGRMGWSSTGGAVCGSTEVKCTIGGKASTATAESIAARTPGGITTGTGAQGGGGRR